MQFQGQSITLVILAVAAAVILDTLLVWGGRWPNPLARIQRWVARSGLYRRGIEAPYRSGHRFMLALGLALLLGSHYAFNQPLPPLGLWRLAWQINGLLRLHLAYPENTLVGSLGLIAGGVLVALSLRRRQPAARSETVEHERGVSIPIQVAPAAAGLLASIVLLMIEAPALLVVLAWLAALILLAVAAFKADRRRGIAVRPNLDRKQLLLLLCLVAAGIAVGAVNLGEFPRSIIGDEGSFWESASAIARGEFRPNPFGFGVYSFPVASSIYQGAIIWMFGASLWSWRFASVLVAALSVVPTYLLARNLFDRRVALLSALAMLVSPYLIAYERMGYNNTQSLLPVAAGLCLLVAGLKRKSWLYLLLAGYAFGAGFYTYTAGRLGLVVGVLYLMFLIGRELLRRRNKRNGRSIRGLLVAGAVALLGWLAVSGPHLSYGTFVDPLSFGHKTLESLFPNVIYAGDVFPRTELFRDTPPIELGGFELFVRADLYARLLLRGMLRSALAFHQGDMITTHYIAGPLAGPSSAFFYGIGLVVMLAAVKRARYALLGLWLMSGVTLLSVINTFPPRHQHMLPVIPVMAILIGLGIRCCSDFLASFGSKSRVALVGVADLAAASIVITGGLTNYFGTVPRIYLPSLEDQINFEALSLAAPRNLLFVYQGREPVEPWVIDRIPNQARYRALPAHQLQSLDLEPDLGYTFYTEPGNEAAIRSFLDQHAAADYSQRSIQDAGGRELGSVFSLGADAGQPAARPRRSSLPGAAGPVAASVLFAFWLLAGVAVLGRRLYQRAATRRAGVTAGAGPHPEAGVQPLIRGRRLSSRTPALDRFSRWRDRLRASDRARPSLSARAAMLELSLLALVVVFFSAELLDFDPNRLLPGNEYGVITYHDQVLVNSLRQDGTFPLWNPFIRAGVPYVADPFNHAFNPVTSVPVLLLGVSNGLKAAVLLSYVLAAVGQWTLGRSLGFGRNLRLWSALIYALSGQAVARFFQGQYVFVFGYAWVPLAMAGVVLTLRKGRPRHIVLAALSTAMVYFSGTTYYAFYLAVFLAGLFVAAALFKRLLSVDWVQLRRLAVVGVFALGLTSLQLLPSLEMRPHWVKPADPELRLSQPPTEALTNLLSSSVDRPFALRTLPPEEFYGFIGPFPLLLTFLAIPALLGAWRSRQILGFGGLLLVAFTWMTVRYTPLAQLVALSNLLNQFRYSSRLMIFLTLAIVNLAGLGLSWLLHRFSLDDDAPPPRTGTNANQKAIWFAAAAVLALSVGQIFVINRRLIGLRPRSPLADRVLEWVSAHDAGTTTVGIPMSTGWHVAAGTHSIRYWDAWYHFDFYPPVDRSQAYRPFDQDPNLLVLGSQEVPYQEDAQPIEDFGEVTVYRLRDSPAMAFSVNQGTLQRASEEPIRASEVQPLEFIPNGPNRFAVVGEAQSENSWVVVRSSYFPGWEVEIDGAPAAVESLNGWTAVRARPGSHRYDFQYRPALFYIGLGISGFYLLLAAVMLTRDFGGNRLRAAVSQARARLFCPGAARASRPASE